MKYALILSSGIGQIAPLTATFEWIGNKALDFDRFCELGSETETNRDSVMQLGMIGLGRMGSAMVHRLLADNHLCTVYDADQTGYGELVAAGAVSAASEKDLVDSLEAPRVVWIMVPADRVDEVIAPLCDLMEPGDIIIDGGNSHYGDEARNLTHIERTLLREVPIPAKAVHPMPVEAHDLQSAAEEYSSTLRQLRCSESHSHRGLWRAPKNLYPRKPQ